MDRADPTLETLDTLELRVLEGPQRGARAPLACNAACVIAVAPDGQAEGAQIVLREPAAPPTRLRISAAAPQAMLEVLEGEVRLGEDTLVKGAQSLWPMHAPLRVGSTVVAFGRAGEDPWPTAAAAGAAGSAASAASGKTVAAQPPLRRRAEVWLASMGAGVLLACAGALWIAHVAAAPRAAPAVSSDALSAALRASEFAELQLTRGADGRIALQGRLATLEQRQRLDAWLREHAPLARPDVLVDEDIARDVAEVFRVNGVAVRTRVAGPGRIAAEASERDRERLAHAEGVVRRDVRGLEQLSVQNSAAPPPPPAPPLSDDPGKRIASLVPGETAYLVTADGARYFIGALLPSGHRVMQIASSSVTLQLNGQQSTLNF